MDCSNETKFNYSFDECLGDPDELHIVLSHTLTIPILFVYLFLVVVVVVVVVVVGWHREFAPFTS